MQRVCGAERRAGACRQVHRRAERGQPRRQQLAEEPECDAGKHTAEQRQQAAAPLAGERGRSPRQRRQRLVGAARSHDEGHLDLVANSRVQPTLVGRVQR